MVTKSMLPYITSLTDGATCRLPVIQIRGIWLKFGKALVTGYALPGDSRGITKHHSNQYARCWRQWRTDELVDVLCPSGAYEKVF